jgi:hypothetical protein
MLPLSRKASIAWRRLRAAVAVLSLGVIALFTPTLVLCESVDGHTAIEPMMSLCCQQGWAGAVAALPQPAEGVTTTCGGDSCDDTPLITSLDAPSTARGVHRGEVVALSAGKASITACESAAARGDRDGWRPPLLAFTQRSTVLRI